MMSVFGGAVFPPLQGLVADKMGIQFSFVVPMVAFAYIAFYGLYGYRLGRPNQTLAADRPVTLGGKSNAQLTPNS
jgi:fucose permease